MYLGIYVEGKLDFLRFFCLFSSIEYTSKFSALNCLSTYVQSFVRLTNMEFCLHLLVITLTILPRMTEACLGHALLHKRQTSGFNITYGDSAPQPPATVGYNLNHLAIVVPNLTATMDFYVNALGFREIFTVPMGNKASFSYLGYPQGGRNGTGYQTAQEMAREKNNADGLLEVIYSEVFPLYPGIGEMQGFTRL